MVARGLLLTRSQRFRSASPNLSILVHARATYLAISHHVRKELTTHCVGIQETLKGIHVLNEGPLLR